MWFVRPMVELALRGSRYVIGEQFLALEVKAVIFAKPDVHAFVDLRCRQSLLTKPECIDGVDANLVFVSNRRFRAFAKQFDRHGMLFFADTQ